MGMSSIPGGRSGVPCFGLHDALWALGALWRGRGLAVAGVGPHANEWLIVLSQLRVLLDGVSRKGLPPSREAGGDVWWVTGAKEVIIRSEDDSRPDHTVVSGKDYP
jgi:hypothetical protein